MPAWSSGLGQRLNGRIYDYALGRFMGVDPFIQAPLNSQSFNAYSYIMNNPLSGTDPTGYCKAEDSASAQTCKPEKADPGSNDSGVAKRQGAYQRMWERNCGVGCRGPSGPDSIAKGPSSGFMSGGNGAEDQAPSGSRNDPRTTVQPKADASSGASAGAPAPTSEENSRPTEGTATLMAVGVVQRINSLSYKDINVIDFEEVAILAEYSLWDISRREREVGAPYSEWKAWEFVLETTDPDGHGDGIFDDWSSRVFDIRGAPVPYSGLHCGCDINYMYQGMLWAAQGSSLEEMRAAITVWNSVQAGLEYSRRSPGLGFLGLTVSDHGMAAAGREFRQIPRATIWAEFGYSYYNKRMRGSP